jgi:hypothetical protein
MTVLAGRRSLRDTSTMRWDRGAHFIWRARPGGAVGATIPAIVVEDVDDVIALFQPSGMICTRRAGVRGGPRGRSLVRGDDSFVDRVYEGPTSVRVHVPETRFEVIRSWTGKGFEGWHINLVSSWRRTRLGFDTWDQILDVLVADDLSSWRWKDEDELAFAQEGGEISAEEVSRARAEGLRAIELMERRWFPFDDDWERFRPDGDRPLPVLPHDWNALD